MKNYYDILGVSQRASTTDIKRAFRKLAIMYHPDRNPSKEAESIIKEIIEAYQILEDPYLRAQYDGLLTPDVQPTVSYQTRPHRDPRYSPKSKKSRHKSEKQLMFEMMQMYMPHVMFITYFTTVFIFILTIDFVLPRQHKTEVISNVYNSTTMRATDEIVSTKEGEKFKVDRRNVSKLTHSAFITVTSSGMFNIPLYLTNNETHDEVRLPATIYGNFIFAPIVLMITSLLGVFYRKVMMLTFNLGIVNGLLFILNLVFLYIPHFTGT